jgi:hypothetical protein
MLGEETSHRRGAGNDPGLADPGAITGMRLQNPGGEALKAAKMAGSENTLYNNTGNQEN